MKITSLVEKDGNVFEFTAELSQEQHQFLIDYAIRALLVAGVLNMNEMMKEPDQAETVN